MGERLEDLLLERVSLGQQAIEQVQPMGLVLGIGQLLRLSGISQFDKAIVGASVGQSGGIHLFSQPEAAVEANVHTKGIPALQADMTAANDGMLIVMIDMKAFALLANGLEPAAFTTATHRHGQARLDGPQHGDEATFDSVTLGDLLNQLFLADLVGAQELIRPMRCRRQALGLFQNPVGQRLGVLGKINQADFGGAQIGAHPLRRKEWAQAGMEAQTVPTAQGAVDQGAELVHNAFGNEVFGQRFCFHKTFLPQGGRVPNCPPEQAAGRRQLIQQIENLRYEPGSSTRCSH